MAASAISSGVIGRCGDMVGVWMEPVTAQVTITLSRCAAMRLLRVRDAPIVAVDESAHAGILLCRK